MGKKIISVRPEIYKEQPPGKYCGAYVVDAILQAGGINVSENPREMLSTLGKLSGAMMPKTLEKLLTENGLSAKIKYGFISSTDELREKIKEEIDGGNPVALAVSRNYTKDHPKAHWISVWGYDSKGVFIYDPRENASNTQRLPIGNLNLNWDKFLEAWKGEFYFRNLFIYCSTKIRE